MNIPPEIITFFSAMVPFLDLKLAIPLGIKMGLSSGISTVFATAGAIVMPAIILAILEPLKNYAELKSPRIKKYLEKILKKTRKEHGKNFKRFGTIFLIALIVAPFPGCGPVTAVLIAFLFGVNYWRGFAIISIGIFITAALITVGTESIIAIFKHLTI